MMNKTSRIFEWRYKTLKFEYWIVLTFYSFNEVLEQAVTDYICDKWTIKQKIEVQEIILVATVNYSCTDALLLCVISNCHYLS